MASGDVEFRCFVGGLAWATTDSSLHEAFGAYGDILESKVRLNQIRPDPRFGLFWSVICVLCDLFLLLCYCSLLLLLLYYYYA